MRKPKLSLRTGLLTLIVLCWLVPMLMVVTLAGILITEKSRKWLGLTAPFSIGPDLPSSCRLH